MSIESMLGDEVSVSDPVLMDFPGLVPKTARSTCSTPCPLC